ncbi:uncharacterized protein SRS1_10821 [Sporisorium reilianum f. sp. reilianum]|uniref:Uncharacterized protein n=1 Tax=Sporisorium reilianum f. sp. reilianum TaxID=72559 RepID=A0A2N8UMP4_9BASI|nr:uncharacterized protein SRS1_10821 [Sporisorium reilianum f. sp. reilianum]
MPAKLMLPPSVRALTPRQAHQPARLSTVAVALLHISSDTENHPHHQAPHSPKSTVTAARNRTVLADITSLTNTPSTLAKLHARTNRTIATSAGAGLRKSVLGHQHRRRTIKRRNAISLTSDQAQKLAGSLTRLTDAPALAAPEAGERAETQEGKVVDVEMRAAAEEQVAGNGSGGVFHTMALQSNLFLITRTDGHAFRCPLSPASKV